MARHERSAELRGQPHEAVVGDARLTVETNVRLAACYSRLGQPEAALEHMARARTMLTAMGDTMALGNVLANMMSTLNGLDRWAESEDILHELESLHLTDPHTIALRRVVIG